VDVIQTFEGELAAGLAIGTGFVGGLRTFLELAEVAGLDNGLAAGSTSLGDLPQEGPEDQAKVPATVAGVGTFVLLGQTGVGNPRFKEGLELMEGGLGGRAEVLELLGEERGEGRKIGCGHVDSAYTVLLTRCLYSFS
jgi:hypothetical protein